MNLLQGVRIALFASASLVMALGFTPSAVAQGAPQDACGVLVEVAQGQPAKLHRPLRLLGLVQSSV